MGIGQSGNQLPHTWSVGNTLLCCPQTALFPNLMIAWWYHMAFTNKKGTSQGGHSWVCVRMGHSISPVTMVWPSACEQRAGQRAVERHVDGIPSMCEAIRRLTRQTELISSGWSHAHRW
jgi:hypothetical protein